MNWYKKAKEDCDFGCLDSVRDMWNKLVRSEQDRVHVSFDLENNDSTGSIRTINLDYRSKNAAKFRVNADLCSAGGDWQCPVAYFKCQFQEKGELASQWSNCVKAIIIPVKSNSNLVKGNKGLTARDDDSHEDCEDRNDSALWKEFKQLAEDRIAMFYKEYAKDDRNSDFGFMNTGCVRHLLDLWESKDLVDG